MSESIIHICQSKDSSIAKSFHCDNPKYQVLVYNTSKSGVMVDIKFEDGYAAMEYYNIATNAGFPATLIEL